MAKAKQYHRGTGKRKVATARVYLAEGKGEIEVNGRPFEKYFGRATDRMIALQPLAFLNFKERFDLKIIVTGSGPTGQAGAIKHGISRALLVFDPELRPQLKKAGFLTRDDRMVERKKYGRSGARRRYQYSKR